MPTSEAQRRANAKWDAANRTQVKLSLPNAEFKALNDYVKSIGVPRATFIREAIKEKMERDSREQD